MELSREDFHKENFDFSNSSFYWGGVVEGIGWLLTELCKLKIGSDDSRTKLEQIEFCGQMIGTDSEGVPVDREKYREQIEKAICGLVKSNVSDKPSSIVYGGLIGGAALQMLGYEAYLDPAEAHFLIDGDDEEYELYMESIGSRPKSDWFPKGQDEGDDLTERYYPSDYEQRYQLCLKLIDEKPIRTATTVMPFEFNTINYIVDRQQG